MSLYTTELRSICEFYSGYNESQGFSKIDEIVENSRRDIFGEYPIFDEKYRGILERKILKHYYVNEIGEETVGLWKLKVNNKMNEIMPYYNKLYESELLKYDPLNDVNVTVSKTGEEAKNKTEISDSNNKFIGNENGNSSKENNGENSKKENLNGNENGTNYNENSSNENKNENIIDSRNSQEKIKKNSNEISSSMTYGENEENISGNKNETETTTAEKNNTKKDKYSDTPQGAITGLEQDRYLTNARIIGEDDTTNTDLTNRITNTENKAIKGVNENSENNSRLEEASNEIDTTGNSSKLENKNGTQKEENTYTKAILNQKEEKENKTEIENQIYNKLKNNLETQKKTNNETSNTVNDYIENKVGKIGTKTYAKMIEEWRKTFLNIDLMIIKDLANLFFGLWG